MEKEQNVKHRLKGKKFQDGESKEEEEIISSGGEVFLEGGVCKTLGFQC